MLLRPQAVHAIQVQEILKTDAISILNKRGYVLITGSEKTELRLLHAQWLALESLTEHAEYWGSFLTAYQSTREGNPMLGDLDSLKKLQALPPNSLITGPLHQALDQLVLHLEETNLLGDKLAKAAELKILYLTKWGAPFFEQSHRMQLADTKMISEEFFKRFLTHSEGEPVGKKHFLEYHSKVLGLDLASQLKKSRMMGSPSENLKTAIAGYLLDQKMIFNISQTKNRLVSIEKYSKIKKDLNDLAIVLNYHTLTPNFIESLRESIETTEPEPRIFFSAPELHVHNLNTGSELDVGDTMVISIAYWVSGLDGNERVVVTEAGAFDFGIAGMAHQTINTVRRKNGGPYIFTVRLPVRSEDPLLYRFWLDTPGSKAVQRTIEIKALDRYPSFLKHIAEAEKEASSCHLQDAKTQLASLEESLLPLADKPQFKRLLKSIRSRMQEISKQMEIKEQFFGAIDGARLYATVDQCEYRTDRAERALKLLSQLPAGCDDSTASDRSLAQEIHTLYKNTHKRMQHQKAFDDAVNKARRLEQSCKGQKAAKLYAAALSLLDSAPFSRCGEWEEEYTMIRIYDLPRAASTTLIEETLNNSLANAKHHFSMGDYSSTLNIVQPLITAIDGVANSRCYKDQRRSAESLAKTTGNAIPPAGPDDIEALLLEDVIDKEVKALLKEQKRFSDTHTEQQKNEQLRQSPIAPRANLFDD